ncbi:hypothetical protein FOC1_g10002714 [Fusarium oxysporum f. sp. cubense race 1]|uniref:Uncharacterized protein n=1 Tax=Fusarium oxysporum f. sp. cubense (strain race 1) TaxID=1229664 RepID=N4U3D4_FUSC1|nr:hypothetical protein FOC1_g10002714 [Fusarium oxysporum f. sp. cubense race 1]
MRLAGLVVALAALAEAQLPETPGVNGASTTTTHHPLPFETTSSEILALDKTTSADVTLLETSTGIQVPDSAFTSTDVLPELPESKSTDIAMRSTGPETTVQQPPAIDTTISQEPPVAETTTQQPPALDTATTATTQQGPLPDTTTQQPPAQDSTTEKLAPQDTTSQPFVGEETTSTQAPAVDTTSSEQPVDEVPSTTEKPEDPKPTTAKQGEAEPTSKDEESDPKSEDSDNEDPKTKDETDPEPTTKKDEAPVTVPPAAVTAEPQETISGVSDNTLHSTKDSDGNDVVVPVLFGPSCLIFCEHAGKDNGPGGIVLWGIGPAPGSYVLPPLPGITPAPSAVVINGGVPTPVGTQTPEDPDDEDDDDDDDDDKSTAEEETKTEAKTTEAKSTAESSAASTTDASTTELPQLTMGVETVVVDVDATPTTGAASSEATTEATSTEASTQTTDVPQLTMGVETVVEAPLRPPLSLPLLKSRALRFPRPRRLRIPLPPRQLQPRPRLSRQQQQDLHLLRLLFSLLLSPLPPLLKAPNTKPKVTEKPDPEPFVKTDDGTVVSYPDRTVKVGNYPGGKYTYTQGVGDAVTLETPLPTQTDANNKGSSQCGSIDDACDRALNDGFDDETVYKDYVSRYARIQSGMVMVATFGQAGCTAQFKCDDYGLGMKGKDIKDAVQYMKDNDGVSKCGTAYLSNTCQITLNYCTNCHHDG